MACVDRCVLTVLRVTGLSGVKQGSMSCRTYHRFWSILCCCWADVLAAAGHLGHVHAAITPLSPAFLSDGDVNNLISP